MCDGNSKELQFLIALSMLDQVGPKTARALLEEYGSARQVFEAEPEKAEVGGRRRRVDPELFSSKKYQDKAAREIQVMSRLGIKALDYRNNAYPARLSQCEDAPVLLYVKGSAPLNPEFSLSVVGTRSASSYGRDMCRELIHGLACYLPGLQIVSGLAYGVDIMAHRAALEAGLPTLAVLAHGLHTVYPYAHRNTALEIEGQGALLSDFHSGVKAERNNFLRRNRIIAGLSQATLVVESAEKGGALTTARMAFSYNREVLVVPGRTTDLRSRGCNKLIKQDLAFPVESPEDILKRLGWDMETSMKEAVFPPPSASGKETIVLCLISENQNLDTDSLCQLSRIPVQELLGLLTEMEIKGWIRSEPGNLYSLSPSLFL